MKRREMKKTHTFVDGTRIIVGEISYAEYELLHHTQ
jgi:hypothetical protein